METYAQFLDAKLQCGENSGFDPLWMPEFLFDFQVALLDWAIRKGRAAIFADCGMGKTPMQLVWAENMRRKTGKPTLILTPLAVSHQTCEEAKKFHIEAERSIDGTIAAGITITNYERLHYFESDKFGAVVCDESSILKNYDGSTRMAVTEFMRKIPYRLLCTATAAPNDYIELGTSSEALGELGHMDMLSRFFRHVDNTQIARHDGFRFKHKEKILLMKETGSLWRFKGHAEQAFWRWVSSWARALRRPSDLGFDDGKFILPPLIETEHEVDCEQLPDGMLFHLPAVGLKEQRDERRRTIEERCEQVAKLVVDTGKPALVWCHLNPEGDLLERLIPDAEQVSGRDSDDGKEEKLLNFAHQKTRVLITKPKIGAWGLNFQHCNHITFFPSHSFEQYYQGVRRCWRFGQTQPVKVDIVTTEGERDVLKNLQRKSAAADKMFSSLVAEMNQAIRIDRGHSFTQQEALPSWLS